ncbi:hypothetical protein XO10_07370 [Marinitoga sp. 1135]|uniref:Chemotaxis signal transduction protein n=1 Tax=Marinitoga piezophila (strain DSM 14283 / JCM 11233 / KA3) TaxID=443254 RepID=H2J473_MARPK|nr:MULTISPECIES: chemotaxis protein CheW [Marinitoga]AEX85888.1 chemotaxis signal transduction protein [Marinitoga piezophila KA3]APT76323.1 hypothetical protein LN42_07950 [Marinitoga sp. 1137]NUU96094.1 hypothetical protein [Marinitoga sp. 1135]NUU98001.1 hypothetical protein [Marinitoga sp. 1138]
MMKTNPFKDLKKKILLKDKMDSFIIFKIKDMQYALKTDYVKYILPYLEVKNVENMPEYIKGTIIYEDIPITLIDMSILLNQQSQEYTDKTFNIVFSIEDKMYSIFTNNIIDVITIDKNILKDAGEEFKEYFFVDKIFSYNMETFMVINPEKLIS